MNFWAFELRCWKRLLRVPWTVTRSDWSILKEISPEHSLEGLMWKLKLQYFGHLMQRTDSFEKTLLLGKIEGRRRRGLDGWMASVTQHELAWAPGARDVQGSLVCCSPWGCKESDTTERMNWTELCFTTDTRHFWVLYPVPYILRVFLFLSFFF